MGTTVLPALDALIAMLAENIDEDERALRLGQALADVEADRLLGALRDEAERQRQVDTAASLRLAGCVVAGAVLADRPEYAALGEMARADALWLLGNYQAAAESYETARRQFAALHHDVGWARTHIGWVIVRYYLGDGAAALDAIGPARDLLIEREEWLRAAALELNAGYVCWRMGQYAAALERFGRAEDLFRDRVPGSDLKLAWLLGNRALVLTEMGQFDAALALHATARATFVDHGNTISAWRTDGYVAEILAARGDFTRALDLHERTLDSLQQSGLGVDAAWTLFGMVTCYLGLNRAAEAADLAHTAIDRFERFATPTEAARARYFAAVALANQSQIDAARALLDTAATAFAATGNTHQQAMVALQQAGLALAEEDWASAQSAAERAATLFAAQQQPVPAAQAQLLRARVHLARQQWAVVDEAARSALAVADECDLPWLAYQAQHLLARVADSGGDAPAALASYAAAMASIDRLQSRLATEFRVTFLDDKLHVYHDAIDCALAHEQAELALSYLERAKSRALVDYLSTAPITGSDDDDDAAGRGMAAEVAQLRAEHAWLSGRRYGDSLGRRPDSGSAGAMMVVDDEALTAAIAERERRIIALNERLALQRARSHQPVPTQAGGAWTAPELDTDTVVLEYYLREDAGAVFVVADGAVTCVPLGITDAGVRRLIQLWHLNLDATATAVAAGEPLSDVGRNARGLLGALFRALMAPVAARLAGRRRVVIVPHGPLHAVPFQALFDGERYLIERLVVTMAPALDLVRIGAARPQRQGVALVLGHSDGGRVPAVLMEARTVAGIVGGQLLLEGDATMAALRTQAAACRLIHVAAHGEARLDNSAFAHVALADGQLITADIFGLDLRGAVVVLSACETGRGQVAAGDEVIGLSRGFLYAGAAALVQTLWRVEDVATAELVASFYRALVTGATTGTALCLAQRAMISSGDHRAEPFYWAAFQSVGDAGMAKRDDVDKRQ